MSASWQVPWISSVLARRELARLAPRILLRTLLVVFACEVVTMRILHWLGVDRGIATDFLDASLLTVLSVAPLYWLVFRPVAEVAAKAAVAPAEARFQAVVEAVSDAIVITEADGAIAFANPAAEPIFGFELKKLLGWPLSVLLPRGARLGRTEAEGCRRDGSRFPAEVSTRVVAIAGRDLRVTVVRDITRRRQAEWELARLASFPRLDPNPILECDAEGRVTYANPAAIRLLQSLGGPEPAARLLPANLPALVRGCLGGCDDNCRAETVVDTRTLLWSFHALPETQRVRAYAVDITARKQAEEALRTSEERYRTLAESAPDAIFVVDRAGVFQYVNSFAAAQHRRKPEEMIGRPVQEFFPPEITARWERGLATMAQTGQVIFEEEKVPIGGAELWLSTKVVPLRDATGEVTAALGISRDVTARKRAEEALRESEERFRQLVETLPVAVRVIQGGKVAFTNPAGATLFGFESVDQVIDTDAFLYVADRDAARLQDYAQKRAAGESVPTHYEFRARRRDGSEFPAAIAVTRINYRAQPASLAVLLDLTERKRLRLFESLLPVCCLCGKVRDDTKAKRGHGSWRALEEYVVEHSDADLTHTFCPDCYRTYREREGLPPAEPPEG